MDLHQPQTLAEALQIKREHPQARPIHGGTDLMVELNFDRARPRSLIDLTRLAELREWRLDGGRLRIGAGVTYTRLITELGDRLPGLAAAARTVGSPQIRNRGTVGGNLGTASPAGDALPPLYASEAEVELASSRGVRTLPVSEFITGPKRNALAPDELIVAFVIEPARGPQQFSKVGTRNAMVIAVCSLAVELEPGRRRVRACVGSAGPTPLRASAAEGFAEETLAHDGLWDSREPLPVATLTRFGELVGAAAVPIDDVRGSASYRRHALAVLGERSLRWAWEQYLKRREVSTNHNGG
jgi:CO/xanthine dehydrogenase FAD-binding subunit